MLASVVGLVVGMLSLGVLPFQSRCEAVCVRGAGAPPTAALSAGLWAPLYLGGLWVSPSSPLRPSSFVSCGALLLERIVCPVLLGGRFAGCLLALQGPWEGQTRDFGRPHSPT